MQQSLLTLVLFLALSCQNSLKNNSTDKHPTMPVSKQQKLENLIANLIHNADAKIEKQVMDEIWQQTYITKIEVGSDPQIYSI